MWNLKQDATSSLSTGLDGLLLQFCTHVSKGGVKPDSEFLTGALFSELQKIPLTPRSCGFEASSLERGLPISRIGPTVIIKQWPHSSLGLSELLGWVEEVLCRPEGSARDAWVAYPPFTAAYCVSLQHLNH